MAISYPPVIPAEGILHGKRYSSSNSQLLAYWSMSSGLAHYYLFKTPRGKYFHQEQTNEGVHITVIDIDLAIDLFGQASTIGGCTLVPFDEAFKIKDA